MGEIDGFQFPLTNLNFDFAAVGCLQKQRDRGARELLRDELAFYHIFSCRLLGGYLNKVGGNHKTEGIA